MVRRFKKSLVASTTLYFLLNSSVVFASNNVYNNERLSGQNRIETAIKIAEESFKYNFKYSDKVILAPAADANLVDSLTVAPLAYKLKAPILLNDDKNSLNNKTLKEIKKHNIKQVYISTGEGVISNKVVKQLCNEGIKVKRLGGINRYETSKNILNEFKRLGGNIDNLAVVSGDGIPDALSMAPISAKEGIPIVLTRDKYSIDYLFKSQVKVAKKVYVIGGKGIISDSLVSDLHGERIAGINRYETNAKVIKRFYKTQVSNIYMGNGEGTHLIDSLTISMLAASKSSPIVLTDNILNDYTKDALKDIVKEETKVISLGSEYVVSTDIVRSTSVLIKDIAKENKKEVVKEDKDKESSENNKQNKENTEHKHSTRDKGKKHVETETKKIEDKNSVDKVKSKLILQNLNNVIDDLILITKGEDGVNIQWKSSNPKIVDNTGKVTRPTEVQGDSIITLTATLIKGEAIDTKDFMVTVKAKKAKTEDALKQLVANNKQEFYNIIKDALNECKTNVSIKVPNYEKNKSDYDLKIVNEILLKNPEVDYGKPSTTANISGYVGNMIMDINFNYQKDVSIIRKEKEGTKKEIQRIINTVIKPGMTDVQKELALHDYVVKTADYDVENYKNRSTTLEDHTAYGVLVRHKGVCESYAKAMYELLNQVGVECRCVTGTGNGGGHAWNIVKLDGQWYNLDATWDDPVSDKTVGQKNDSIIDIKHTYFNISDSEFNKDHIRGDFEKSHPDIYPVCISTIYSYDNLNIDEFSTDGNKIAKVVNKTQLDKQISDGIKTHKNKIYLKVKGLNMNIQQLLDEVKVVIQNQSLSGFKQCGVEQSGDYIVYNIEY